MTGRGKNRNLQYFHGKEILQLHNQGMNQREIAAALNIPVSRVNNWMWINEVMAHPGRKEKQHDKSNTQ